MNKLAWLLVGALVLSACGSPATSTLIPTNTIPPPTATPSPCDKAAVESASAEFGDVMDEWEDATRIASATARINLGDVVSSLQDIQNTAEDINAPPCLRDAQTYTVQGMEFVITGYLDFMAQKSDSVVSASFNSAEEKFSNAAEAVTTVRACAPDC